MYKCKKIIVLFLIFVLSISLSACNEELKDKKLVISEIERIVPNAEFVNYKNEDRARTYVFNMDEFSFEYRDYLWDDSIFGFDQNSYECNYLDELFIYLEDDVEKIANDNNVYIYDCRKMSCDKEELNAIIHDNNIVLHVSYSDIYYFYIHNYDCVKNVYDFLLDIENLLEDYMLQEISDVYIENIQIDIRYIQNFKSGQSYNNEIYNFDWNFVEDNVNFKTCRKWTKYWYQEYVHQGLLPDNINNAEHKPHKIEKLYINGKEFTSNVYNIEFIYNIEDDNYYVEVIYGNASENEKLQDSLQKEIIDVFYPESNYIIDNEEEETTYRIGKNKYKINWVYADKFHKEKDKLQFYKNNKKLNIETFSLIGKTHANSYNDYYFISIDDFAMLMEMEIDEIDIYSKIIYLKTK